MSNAAAAQWVKFFNASGIPSPAAAGYAHIFVENRIQNDMLMDLNKEYLREMGITPMGDIIAILRHAKSVSDQKARDKVLISSDVFVPIAAVPANPHSSQERPSTTTKIRLKSVPVTSSTPGLKTVKNIEIPPPKTIRRVLPEHEGKYKIKLPSGTTKRSKEILAKHKKLYSDREKTQRTHVFDRLTINDPSTIDLVKEETTDEEVVSSASCRSEIDCNADNSSSTIRNVRVCITGINGANNKTLSGSSIFSRLGGKTADGIDDESSKAKEIKPILKNSQNVKCRSAIVKAKTVASSISTVRIPPQKQKVILVKKVPVKTNESDDNDVLSSDNDVEMDDAVTSSNAVSSSEKIVKFASTAEVHEIAPEPHFKQQGKNFHGFGSINVRGRLGSNSLLHTTKKTYNLKAANNKNTKSSLSPVKIKSIRLKSDEILMRQEVPVRNRLGFQKSGVAKKSIASLANRVGNVTISRNSTPKSRKQQQNNSSSVFDRLGFNN